MANEVTINIESSLAAMAFVLADQQQDLKDLRGLVKDLQHDSGAWENACKEKQRELEDLQKRFADLNEEASAESSRADMADEAMKEMGELHEKALEKEREQHQNDIANLENVKLPRLNWIPWNGELVSTPVSSVIDGGRRFPTALRIYRVEKEDNDNFDITGKRSNVGDVIMEISGLSLNGENIDMPCNCRYGLMPLYYTFVDCNDLLTVADKCMIDRIGQAEAE